MNQFSCAICVFLGITLSAGSSSGQDANAVDKWDYTLFRPTPREAMRQWHTDHAGLSPYTTDAGHFEADVLAVNYATIDDVFSSDVWVFGIVRLKAGLANNVDLEVGTPGYLTEEIELPFPPGTIKRSGFTDVIARLKVNLWGNDEGTTALAISGGVTFPTATDDLAHDGFAGGPGLEFATQLPCAFELRINCHSTLFNVDAPVIGEGIQANIQNLISVSHAIVGSLEGYVLFNTVVSTVDVQEWVGDIRVGLNYRLTPCVELYAGSGFGVQGLAADYNPFIGIATRF